MSVKGKTTTKKGVNNTKKKARVINTNSPYYKQVIDINRANKSDAVSLGGAIRRLLLNQGKDADSKQVRTFLRTVQKDDKLYKQLNAIVRKNVNKKGETRYSEFYVLQAVRKLRFPVAKKATKKAKK